MDEKLEELNKQATEDLENVVTIEYGNSQGDVNAVNTIKSQLEQLLTSLTNNKDEQFTKLDTDYAKFTKFKAFLEDTIATQDITNNELTSVLKEQLPALEKGIQDIEKHKDQYIAKIAIIEKVLEYLTFKVKEDGKCYVEQFAIDFAKLMLA